MVLPLVTRPNKTKYTGPPAVDDDIDVSTDRWNAVVTAINNLLLVQIFDAVIPMNGNHVLVTHSLGSVPMAVVLAPVDDVGRCWYDMNTISDTTIDIYVANPPLDGGYLIHVILYYM